MRVRTGRFRLDTDYRYPPSPEPPYDVETMEPIRSASVSEYHGAETADEWQAPERALDGERILVLDAEESSSLRVARLSDHLETLFAQKFFATEPGDGLVAPRELVSRFENAPTGGTRGFSEAGGLTRSARNTPFHGKKEALDDAPSSP